MCKKIFCLICSFIMLLLPIMCRAESTMTFLKTAVVDIIGDKLSAQELYESEGLRATVAIALQISLFQQKNIDSKFFDMKTTYVGYNGDCFYVVSAYSETQRVVYELDLGYHICKYELDNDADISQNETVCKEFCTDYYLIDQKEYESAFYKMINQ